jgi:nitroreductase
MEDAVYRYNPCNHSLILYKEGEYLHIVGWQYPAPLVLGLVWNMTQNDNEYVVSAQLGEIGQNIYFTANAMSLGCVITGTLPNCPMEQVGLPDDEKGRYVMYLGHPAYEYDFIKRPFLISFLPRIKSSKMRLTAAIGERNDTTSWGESILTRKEQTQLLWSSYGFSYYIDQSEPGINFFNITRHRTIPSGCGIYPFRIYAVTETRIYRYIPGIFDIIYDSRFNGLWWLPVITFTTNIAKGDYRDEIAQASQPYVSEAPFNIITVLDINKTDIDYFDWSQEWCRWIWYYEAGACSHNVMLEATARGCSGSIALISDKNTICSILHLDQELFDPMLVVSVGK